MDVKSTNSEGEDIERGSSSSVKSSNESSFQLPSYDPTKYVYIFDGTGNYGTKNWDLGENAYKSNPQGNLCRGGEFCWYHVELSKGNKKLSHLAQHLIGALSPPLSLQEILSLISNGPFCGHVDGALVFRVNSPGPISSKFTFRIAARVTESLVITVSLGRVPRLGFSVNGNRKTLLSEIPARESRERKVKGGFVIKEDVLDFFLRMNNSEEVDNPVPRSVSNLVVHIIDAHMDHLQNVVTMLEIDLDPIEFQVDKGGFALKKQLLNERKFSKMHLHLQRLLQVIAHGEQVFPRVKEKCASKEWFASEDISALEELIGRLRRLKENVGFIADRVGAIQAGLDSWQSEQINIKLYYLSFLSIVFLPLSVITGVFGMNVGGVPWTGQDNPVLSDGFRNVMLMCAGMLVIVLVCFIVPNLYSRLMACRRREETSPVLPLNWKSYIWNTEKIRENEYVRI